MNREDLRQWADSAYDAQDYETYLIAVRALGRDFDPHATWGSLRQSRVRQIARMTPAGAQRIASKWKLASEVL